jgi:hypothetical protein
VHQLPLSLPVLRTGIEKARQDEDPRFDAQRPLLPATVRPGLLLRA